MADPTPQPTPIPAPTPAALPWYKQPWFTHVIAAMLPTLVGLLVWAAGGFKGQPQPAPIPIPDPVPEWPTRGYGMGWRPDEAAREAFVSTLKYPRFAATPAGQADVPDTDVFMWNYVRQAWSKYSGPAKTSAPYPNVDQADTGICCGCGTKHAEDALTAVLQEAKGALTDWEPIAVESVYAESRVNIGHNQLQGEDGSNGSWVAQAARDYGNLLMRPYPSIDLSRFDPHRVQEWGDSGVPASLQSEAKKHVVQHISQVHSWDDCRKAIAQGYTLIMATNTGFNKPGTRRNQVNPGTRDKDGFIAPNGVWPHCMAGIGMVGGSRPGLFILNSWGDKAHGGPVGKGNPPIAGFYVDARVVDQMCKQRGSECYALSGFDGFPAQQIDWPTLNRRQQQANLFAVFSLSP
jgi:hypothetical protein